MVSVDNREGLYSTVVRIYENTPDFDGDKYPLESPYIPQQEKDFYFAMACNGYAQNEDGTWFFEPFATVPFREEFIGQQVSFFGPGRDDLFYSSKKVGRVHFEDSFRRPGVLGMIRKYREIDEDQAARIAFLLGGIVRSSVSGVSHPSEESRELADSVQFAASMTKLGDKRSADAIASAMAMYAISGGPIDRSNSFMRDVYMMSEAIGEDDVYLRDTKDLGISQVARLRNFFRKINGQGHEKLPDVNDDLSYFEDFPTSGAEFHFTVGAAMEFPRFWQRLALLNMSQYQRGSYIQLSRNDRDVIEVRMNPSVYPVTIANWQHMGLLLPELRNAYFFSTVNRPTEKDDFSWDNGDKYLLDKLRALGMLSYALVYNGIPVRGERDEVTFGSVYLGQTQRMKGGRYLFSGQWCGSEGKKGQLSVYTGYGENFKDLTYYLSTVLSKPGILGSEERDFLSGIRTLENAFCVDTNRMRYFIDTLQRRIKGDGYLGPLKEAGERIMSALKP